MLHRASKRRRTLLSLLILALPLQSFARDAYYVRCTGQVRRQYLNPDTVRDDSMALPVAVVGSRTFQEDLQRIAVSPNGQAVEMSVENVLNRGIHIVPKAPPGKYLGWPQVMRGRGSLHFDGGYSAKIQVFQNGPTEMPVLEVSLLKTRGDHIYVLGTQIVDLKQGRGHATVENAILQMQIVLLKLSQDREEADLIHDVVSRGEFEDGVVTLLDTDCQVISRKKAVK